MRIQRLMLSMKIHNNSRMFLSLQVMPTVMHLMLVMKIFALRMNQHLKNKLFWKHTNIVLGMLATWKSKETICLELFKDGEEFMGGKCHLTWLSDLSHQAGLVYFTLQQETTAAVLVTEFHLSNCTRINWLFWMLSMEMETIKNGLPIHSIKNLTLP